MSTFDEWAPLSEPEPPPLHDMAEFEFEAKPVHHCTEAELRRLVPMLDTAHGRMDFELRVTAMAADDLCPGCAAGLLQLRQRARSAWRWN